jgi:hypothetical protein
MQVSASFKSIALNVCFGRVPSAWRGRILSLANVKAQRDKDSIPDQARAERSPNVTG